MFAKIGSSLVAIKKYVRASLGNVKTQYVIASSMLAVLFMGTQPAMAATPGSFVKAAAPNPLCYIGAPDLTWLDPAKAQTKLISGIVLGILIILAAVGTIWGAIRVATAGKHSEKAKDGIKQVSNVLLGLLVGFGGLVVVSIFVTILVSLVNFKSC